VLDAFSRDGFAPLRAEWESHHAHQGKAIALKLPDGRTHEGVARGVGDDGALLFDQDGAIRRLHSGEIAPSEMHPEAASPALKPARRA